MFKRKVRFHKILLIVSVSVLTIAAICGISFIALWNNEKLDVSKLQLQNQNAIFYDCENQLINTPTTRKYCPLENVNPDCIKAFIAVEDKNFYSHHGLSYPRIIKAATTNLTAGYSKEGASTITQQLIKNTHLTNEKTLKRKVREAILALKLEQKYSKAEIMEMYLNAIYFGNNLYGIANASEFYFNKSPSELTLAESAGLAGLIKNPSRYDPISHHETFLERAHLVLSLMREQDLIDFDTYQTALDDPLTINASQQLWIAAPYQTMALKEAAQILNLSETDIVNYGYKIETYYNPENQKLIYDAMNQPEYNLTGDKFTLLSAPNGQVNALWTSNNTLLNARRNFGSAMKPLLVYAPALELGIVQPETQIDDSPLIGSEFNPQNYDHKYHGMVTTRAALIHSYNVPAVKILNATTIKNATQIANKLGQNLTDNENLSMALGNTNRGTSFLELATGYQTIANYGRYSPARFIRSIRDRKGNTVYFDLSNKYNYAPQVITEDTAYLLTDMLVDTVKTGTAKKLSHLGQVIAAKTGTTERTGNGTNTDATLVSYTPNHVLIVWQGNATMRPEDDLPHGVTGGGQLGNSAKQIHSALDNPIEAFARPNSIKEINLDALDYREGNLNIASQATPLSETVVGLFAGRYAPKSISKNYLVAVPTTLDGKIGDNSIPEIWFETLPHQTYEIYKNDILQEVIKNQYGQYTFYDKKPQNVNHYYIKTILDGATPQISNQITIRLHDKIKRNPVEQKQVPWYF